MTSASARESHSGSVGATDTEPTCAMLPTLRTGTSFSVSSVVSIDLIEHERLRVDSRALAATERFDDRLDATAIGRVVLPEVQDAKRAHSEAASRRGTSRMCGNKSRYSSVMRRACSRQLNRRACARLAAHRARQSVAAADRSSRSSEIAATHASNVADRAIRRRTPTDLDERGNAAGDDRRAAGHRLGDRQSEPFALRRLQQHRRTAVKRRQHAPIDERQHRRPRPPVRAA